VPVAVGVPLKTPVAGFSASQGGRSVPDQVYGYRLEKNLRKILADVFTE
jgi:hypothetical protein